MSDLRTSSDAFNSLTAIYNQAKQIVDNKKTGKQGDTIIRLTDNGPEHKITAEVNGDDKIRGLFKTWAKRSEPNKQANNTTRDIFKDLVLRALGKEDLDIKKLPKALKEAMNVDDFDGKGHPLSARRIVDAYKAIKDFKNKKLRQVSNNLYSILKDETKRNTVDTSKVGIYRSSEVKGNKVPCMVKHPLRTMYGASSKIAQQLAAQYPGEKIAITIAGDGTETGGGLFRSWTTQEESTLRDANVKTLANLYNEGVCKFNENKDMDKAGHKRLEYQPGKSPAEDPFLTDIQFDRVDNVEIKQPVEAMAGFLVLPSLTWHSHSFDRNSALANLENCRKQQGQPLTEHQKANAEKAIDIMLAKIKAEIDGAGLVTNDETGEIYKPVLNKEGKTQKDKYGNPILLPENKTTSKSGFENAKVFSEALKAFSFSNANDLKVIFDCPEGEDLGPLIDSLFKNVSGNDYQAPTVETNYQKEILSKFEKYFMTALQNGVKKVVGLPIGCGVFMNNFRTVLPLMVKAYFNVGGDMELIWSQFKEDNVKDTAMRECLEEAYNREATERNLPDAPKEEIIAPNNQNLLGDSIHQLDENDFHLLEPNGVDEQGNSNRVQNQAGAQQNANEINLLGRESEGVNRESNHEQVNNNVQMHSFPAKELYSAALPKPQNPDPKAQAAGKDLIIKFAKNSDDKGKFKDILQYTGYKSGQEMLYGPLSYFAGNMFFGENHRYVNEAGKDNISHRVNSLNSLTKKYMQFEGGKKDQIKALLYEYRNLLMDCVKELADKSVKDRIENQIYGFLGEVLKRLEATAEQEIPNYSTMAYNDNGRIWSH